VLTQAVQKLTNLKAQALAAQQAKNGFMLNKVLKDAKAAATPALAQWDLVSATFAPDNPIRTSADIHAANIAQEDSQTLISHHFDALNQVNKTNLALKKNIDTLAAEIEAVKTPKAAERQGTAVPECSLELPVGTGWRHRRTTPDAGRIMGYEARPQTQAGFMGVISSNADRVNASSRS
jgi:hypothetical protein